MKVIICGSRYLKDFDVVANAVRASGFAIHEVVSGGAAGADRLGEEWAVKAELPGGFKVFLPRWNAQGPKAGPLRNQEMVDYADAVIAIPCPKSRGTWDCVRRAQAKGIPVYIHREALGTPAANVKTH